MIKKLIFKFKVKILKKDMKSTKREDISACAEIINKKKFELAKDIFIEETKVIFNGTERQIKNFMKNVYILSALRDGSVNVSERYSFNRIEGGVECTEIKYTIKPELL